MIKETKGVSALTLAVQSRNLGKIKDLLKNGADITYKGPGEYDVLMDAMVGSITAEDIQDTDLFDVVELLLREGASPNRQTGHKDSGLSFASGRGRFDIVKLLLKYGADPKVLKWNPLMFAVVFGTFEEMKSSLIQKSSLYYRDDWDRTPFLLSVQAGDIRKTEFLLSSGANRKDTGLRGWPPFMYAVENNDLEMMTWLARNDFDINASRRLSRMTPLMMAVQNGSVESTIHLLTLGADLNKKDKHGRFGGKAIAYAKDPEIMNILIRAGARLEEINDKLRKKLRGSVAPPLSGLSESRYRAQKSRQFGKSNPEIMEIDFWKAMVVSGRAAWYPRSLFNDEIDRRAPNDDPVWCFDRYGMSITGLPDGRIVEIAGEHEGSYDPDFCIYNEVVEHRPDGNFTIYGYPEEVFPPTDFHTATLVDDSIYIIGNLGYRGRRRFGETPVFKLNTVTFEIEKVETRGEPPGWVSRHTAYLRDGNIIQITGGKLSICEDGKEKYINNKAVHLLDLNTNIWTRVKRRAPYRPHFFSPWSPLSLWPGGSTGFIKNKKNKNDKNMQIHIDAKNGNVQGVSDALDKGVSVESIDKKSKLTPLMAALTSKDAGIDMVRFLIHRGADVNRLITLTLGRGRVYPLTLAVQSRNLEKIKLLLENGADIKYKRPGGYDVVIDAMYRHMMSMDIEDTDLFAVIELLLKEGGPADGLSKCKESALNTASNPGRFDIVELLLKHGADPGVLKWSPLMFAVVFGTLAEVKSCLDRGAGLFDRDSWDRTPFLLSVQAGDIPKAEFLLSVATNRKYTGASGKKKIFYFSRSGRTDADRRCKTPFLYAAENNDLEMMTWLARNNFDVNETHTLYQTTPLMAAAANNLVESTKHLLSLGANVDKKNEYDEPAISMTTDPEVMRVLIHAGARLEEINKELRQKLRGSVAPLVSDFSESEYLSQKHRVFGKSNPEIMDIDFWKAMVVSGRGAWHPRSLFNDKIARTASNDSPVWCFERFGMSITELPDGRIIEIAGEHEDYYDPDFCIYNEVVEHRPDGNFTIYGYPEELFPPTDFHTATLVDDSIYIIGNLSYKKHRRYGETQVFKLNTVTFQIERVETGGVSPGWINGHTAHLEDGNIIQISGGKLCIWEAEEGKEEYVDNNTTYSLDVTTGKWTKEKKSI